MTLTNLTQPSKAEPISPDGLLRMSGEDGFELVEGRLLERNMGAESSAIAMQIGWLLLNYLAIRKTGHLFGTDVGYQCFGDSPSKVRRADVSFVRKGRFPEEKVPKGYISISPDLAVEVESPNDLAEEVSEKVREYLSAGVPLVWVVYPSTREVVVHRPRTSEAGSQSKLEFEDTITGEDVLPGFECKVADFFASL